MLSVDPRCFVDLNRGSVPDTTEAVLVSLKFVSSSDGAVSNRMNAMSGSLKSVASSDCAVLD